MQHDSNVFRGGLSGVGALMDPEFLRDATHPDHPVQADPVAGFRKKMMSALQQAEAWLSELLHRAT